MEASRHEEGQWMHRLMTRLFPICRSITGNGVRETLRILREFIPLELREVPTGTQVFDWEIPKEWNIRDAYILDGEDRKIVDFRQNNLHVVGYSIPVDRTMSLQELQPYLYSLPEQPEAIPYVTSYYQERWGFCLSHRQREQLRDGLYTVRIDSELSEGSLTYGEVILPGASEREVFLSTYVCHPSMANNELSGLVLATALTRWLAGRPRRYTYRIVFVPETIGAIAYLSRHHETMRERIAAGYNISCVGDERAYSYLASRRENTLADRAALHVLRAAHPDFIRYSFLDRGSDERQYCSPGIDLPVASIMRSKYGTYPEYHTSEDDLSLATPAGLQGSYEIYCRCLELIERNARYRATCYGEPQLGKRGLYPTLSARGSAGAARTMMNFLAYADGEHDLIGISEQIHAPVQELYPLIDTLAAHGLLAAEE